MPSAAFTDAWVKYLTRFPTKDSLGVNAATWQAELDRVAPGAFDQMKATQVAFEGSNLTGISNFDQMELVRALYAVRAYRDADFENPYLIPAPEPMASRSFGALVRLGSC